MPVSDRRMFELWREREKMKERITKINKAIVRRDQAIIAEFERRGIKSLEERETGERITIVQSETIVYIPDKLKKRLARSPRGRAVLKRCTRQVIDTKAIAAEVLAGNVPPEIAADCSEIKVAQPYLRGGGGGE